MKNPLLQLDPLAEVSIVAPEHVVPAIEHLLVACESALQLAEGNLIGETFEALSAVVDVPLDRLSVAWGVVNLLRKVADTPEMRAAHALCLPKIVDFRTRFNGSQNVLQLNERILSEDGFLTPARRRVLQNRIRDFRFSGAGLAGPAVERYAAIQQRLAELSQRFSNNLLDATDRFSLQVSADRLAGLPADVLAATRDSSATGSETHTLTLKQPVVFPVLQFAKDRALRESMSRAYLTRASGLGPAELDNGPIVRELMALRHEQAALFDRPHYADLSLIWKMAESADAVVGFLRDLARRARPQAEQDLQDLKDFARTECGLDKLEAWDVSYVGERLRTERYAFSRTEVRQYFDLERALRGMFALAEKLFDVKILPTRRAFWNETVRSFRVERTGHVIGDFYLDPYARPGKSAGAWMDGHQPRWLRPDGELRTAVAFLVCNFAAPAGNESTALDHDELSTLFHEFGHGLHFLLSKAQDLGVSGISGVEWDAVELPSQLMENFCWEWDTLAELSGHAETGAKLPRRLFDKMFAARHFQSGLQLLRQVELAIFDMRLHAEPGSERDVDALLAEVRREVGVMPTPDYSRMANGFSHIFAGGYAAGYYSYLWAEVLSADAWSAFEEEGVSDIAAWTRYRASVLEVGGTRPAKESFRAFRGRDADVRPLLRQRGICETVTAAVE